MMDLPFFRCSGRGCLLGCLLSGALVAGSAQAIESLDDGQLNELYMDGRIESERLKTETDKKISEVVRPVDGIIHFSAPIALAPAAPVALEEGELTIRANAEISYLVNSISLSAINLVNLDNVVGLKIEGDKKKKDQEGEEVFKRVMNKELGSSERYSYRWAGNLNQIVQVNRGSKIDVYSDNGKYEFLGVNGSDHGSLTIDVRDVKSATTIRLY